MENRKALLPLCSGLLGVISLILQVIAVATPYWVYFHSEDPVGSGNFPAGLGNYVEAGHYGLWRVCLTTYEIKEFNPEKCDISETRFQTGKLRYLAGALAIVDVLLLLFFLFPIPAQLAYFYDIKAIVNVSYRTLTFIKILTLIFGAGCGVAAAVLVGIHTQSYYETPKGWSFGLQIVVVILQVFLFICATTEHVIGRRFPNLPLQNMKRESHSKDGLQNPGFSMASPDNNIVTDKGLQAAQFKAIAFTNESGKPYYNKQETATAQQDLNEPGNRKSMQYVEELDLKDARKKPKPQNGQKPKTNYRNAAYKSSRDSDLDASNPSISSRSGRYNSANLSSDTTISFSKSTDV